MSPAASGHGREVCSCIRSWTRGHQLRQVMDERSPAVSGHGREVTSCVRSWTRGSQVHPVMDERSPAASGHGREVNVKLLQHHVGKNTKFLRKLGVTACSIDWLSNYINHKGLDTRPRDRLSNYTAACKLKLFVYWWRMQSEQLNN